MTQTIGRVLYGGASEGASVTYDGTETAGFEKENAFDWVDWSLFRASSGSSYLDLTVGSSKTISGWAGYIVVPDGAVSYEIDLQYEESSGLFTSLDSVSQIENNVYQGIWFRTFSPVTLNSGDRVRFSITTPTGESLDIRNLAVSDVYAFPIGQHVGISPPNLLRGVVGRNSISSNGSFLGRTVRRADVRSQIELDYLSEDHVRNSWEPFARWAARKSFFYGWDLDDHSTEAVLAVAESINGPENSTPVPTMKASMPIRCLSDVL